MSPSFANAAGPVAIAMRLEEQQRSFGNSSPSTSEGALQGHPCPKFLQQQNLYSDASLGQVNGCMLGATESKMVMGRYMMSMTKDGFLGEGSFSVCRKAVDLMTGDDVAIKAYKGSLGNNDESARSMFLRQVDILLELQDGCGQHAKQSQRQGCAQFDKSSKFFIQLIDYSRDESGSPGLDCDDGVFYVVMELAESSLKDYIRSLRAQGEALSRDAVRQLGRSVVMASAALHAKGFVHLDLKPENMMICKGRLKINDVDGCVRIGSVISLQDSSSSFSPCYCAPEWAKFLQAGDQAEIVADARLDSWSVGLTLCECATLSPVMRPAFTYFLQSCGSAPEAHANFVAWLSSLETSPVPDCVEKFDAELGQFLSRGLLECDPSLRLTPEDCLSSSYFSGL